MLFDLLAGPLSTADSSAFCIPIDSVCAEFQQLSTVVQSHRDEKKKIKNKKEINFDGA